MSLINILLIIMSFLVYTIYQNWHINNIIEKYKLLYNSKCILKHRYRCYIVSRGIWQALCTFSPMENVISYVDYINRTNAYDDLYKYEGNCYKHFVLKYVWTGAVKQLYENILLRAMLNKYVVANINLLLKDLCELLQKVCWWYDRTNIIYKYKGYVDDGRRQYNIIYDFKYGVNPFYLFYYNELSIYIETSPLITSLFSSNIPNKNIRSIKFISINEHKSKSNEQYFAKKIIYSYLGIDITFICSSKNIDLPIYNMRIHLSSIDKNKVICYI